MVVLRERSVLLIHSSVYSKSSFVFIGVTDDALVILAVFFHVIRVKDEHIIIKVNWWWIVLHPKSYINNSLILHMIHNDEDKGKIEKTN